jgi:hypothetical protein
MTDYVYDFDEFLPSKFIAMVDDDPIENKGKPLTRNGKIVTLRLESFRAIERSEWGLNGAEQTYPELYGLFRDTETGAAFAFIGHMSDTDCCVKWVSVDNPCVSLTHSFERGAS